MNIIGGKIHFDIREASGKDAREVLEFLERVCRETTFLTIGPGEFNMSEQDEFSYLETCQKADHCLYLLALMEKRLSGHSGLIRETARGPGMPESWEWRH